MSKKIFIVSGGTGGHIIPAYCLAKHLVQQNHKIYFFGDNKINNFIKPHDQFEVHTLRAQQFKKSPLEFIKFIINTKLALLKSLYFLLKIRPDFLYSFGGYATFPMLLGAVITRRKIILHEQNSHLGKVNRLFAKYATKIALSFENTDGIEQKYLNKTIHTGNPIRDEILKLFNKPYLIPNLDSESNENNSNKLGYDVLLNSDFYPENNSQKFFKILVIGGSGGTKIFSEVLPKAFFNFSEEIKEHIQIFQQCRSELVESTFEQYRAFNINIVVDSFFEDMAHMIDSCNLVIARAGASSIFEFCCAGKPMILIPFAKSADNHQQKNADFLSKEGAAIVVKEEEFNIQNINEILNRLFLKKDILSTMSSNAKKLAIVDATENLSKLINQI